MNTGMPRSSPAHAMETLTASYCTTSKATKLTFGIRHRGRQHHRKGDRLTKRLWVTLLRLRLKSSYRHSKSHPSTLVHF